MATLDGKAFDKVNHFKLCSSLIKAGMIIVIVQVLMNWYSKLSVAVRWNSKLHAWFAVKCGVRQAFGLRYNDVIEPMKLGMGAID